jgi:crotonobetainyl-CoA:carnitine CoA-transferase CaiB-like acyl-CoA transferase
MALEDLTDQQRKALGLGELMLQAKDPNAQKEWKRLAKKINPGLQFPELDLEDQMAALDKRQAEWEAKQQEREIKTATASRHEKEDQAAEAAGFKPEDIRKFAEAEGIGSFDAALKFKQLEQESAEPTASTYGGPRPAELLPEDWRKMTPAQRVARGQQIFHEGITQMQRRLRANR